VAPVDVEPVGDDADPDAGVRQPPQHLGRALDGGHGLEDAVVGHGGLVEPLELVRGQAPLAEVPRPLQRQRRHVDALLGHHDVAERAGVVAAHAVEVDAQDEAVAAAHAVTLAGR
jgi:hypothetical protein